MSASSTGTYREAFLYKLLFRDVKPSNMCVGNANRMRTIYLVDFGMTRQFRYDDGTIRKERFYAGFRLGSETKITKVGEF